MVIHIGGIYNETSSWTCFLAAFLARGDYNIFWVDWGQMAATPWYNAAARNTKLVGRHTATLLDHLHRSTGTSLEDFHVVGFSLGSHVAGIVGKSVRAGRVKKITGTSIKITLKLFKHVFTIGNVNKTHWFLILWNADIEWCTLGFMNPGPKLWKIGFVKLGLMKLEKICHNFCVQKK